MSDNTSRGTMLKVLAVSFTILLLGATSIRQGATLYLVGDSTMADKANDPPNPEHGWGQLLARRVRAPFRVSNHAVNGRSSRSFINEGRWKIVLDSVRAGDVVLVQFAHNDEKVEDTARFAAARGAYEENLIRFAHDVRAKHATIVFATPVVRRKWDSTQTLVDTHGDYPAAMKDAAAREHVPLLDMQQRSAEIVKREGVDGSKLLYLWIPAGAYVRKPEGWQDDTHFSELGATRMADAAISEMRRLKLPIGSWFTN